MRTVVSSSVPPEPQDPLQTPRQCMHLSLSLSPSLSSSSPPPSLSDTLSFALRCSTSVEQEHRTESHLRTHAVSLSLHTRTRCMHTHIRTHARTHTHSFLRYPIRRSGFSSGIPSASSPSDGSCSSRVSARTERRGTVPLNRGRCLGSLPLFESRFPRAGVAFEPRTSPGI